MPRFFGARAALDARREPAGSHRRRDLAVSLVLLGAVLALAIVTVTVPPSSPRTWLLVATLATAPGWAVVGFRPPAAAAVAASAAVGLSLAVSILVSLGLLLAHAWHPVTAFWALLAATAVLLAFHAARLLRRGPA